ncbi:DNA-binding transcriptional regulator YiaG [Chryseobacterium sp. H1D6B]|uniref:helix-turn-helix domain-containing protein n=1 Tax=Chryseobacterium sp. H1D6B TaxID=2940588 RepID=UPI0015CA2935|nr:helix-turn-helix domain-containing protein [Chryseobacterium sp. H1D6B]MDH6252964.1 DNA-binding transcriptional regulator YiaG [Chryseobacterium sp. H1D6B]
MTTFKKPNYKKIYEDILTLKFPGKKKYCQSILSKAELSVNDVIHINDIIFQKSDRTKASQNQKHRSYDMSYILEILDYQKKHQLNNSQLAAHFGLSRNTVTKWKKQVLV